MNKKFLVAIMTIALGSMVFTGCGSKGSANNTNSSNNTVVETPAENEEVVVDEIVEEPVADEEEVVEEVVGEVDPTPAQEMFFVITDGVELPASMAIDGQTLSDLYGMDEATLASYSVNIPMMNVHATEIAVFELKDDASKAAVEAGIEKRVADLKTQWGSYLPAQYELVNNYQVVEKGNFVLFVISESADAIVANFEAAVQ